MSLDNGRLRVTPQIRQVRREPGVVWTALAILAFGTVAGFLSIKAAAGGHGSFLPAKLLFPFAMIAGLTTGDLRWLGYVLGVLQYPAYAWSLVSAILRGRAQRTAAVILLIHAVAVILCLAVNSGPFNP